MAENLFGEPLNRFDKLTTAKSFAYGSRAGPTPTASGILLASTNGELVLVNPATGTRHWSARVRGPLTQPAVVDGRFFVAVSTRGQVIAFR